MNILFGIIIFCMAMGIVAWLLSELGLINPTHESTYRLTYRMIQSDIRHAEMTMVDYQDINDKIERMSKLPGNNPEMTTFLDIEFRIKFEEFINEFEPSEIFVK